jgi:hypothetical protein
VTVDGSLLTASWICRQAVLVADPVWPGAVRRGHCSAGGDNDQTGLRHRDGTQPGQGSWSRPGTADGAAVRAAVNPGAADSQVSGRKARRFGVLIVADQMVRASLKRVLEGSRVLRHAPKPGRLKPRRLACECLGEGRRTRSAVGR